MATPIVNSGAGEAQRSGAASAAARAARYLLALGIIAALVLLVDYRELLRVLGELTPLAVLLLVLISAVMIYTSAIKWQYFLDSFGAYVPAIRLFKLYLIGYFVNIIVPSYVGGDVVRSLLVGKRFGRHEALSATILERYTGMVAMMVLALGFIWFVDGATLEMKAAVAVIAAGLGTITVAALSPGLLDRLERQRRLAGVVKHLRKIQTCLNLARKDRTLVAKSLALSFLFHCFTVFNTVAAAWAVGWFGVPVGDLFVVLPIILLIGAIPITPSGLGIQEGAFFFFLTSLGATPAQALGVGVVLRAKIYLLALVGGLLWLTERSRPKEIEQ